MQEDKRIKQIQKLLDSAEGNLHSARNLLLDILGEKKTGKVDHKESAHGLSILDEGKVIEGVFEGEQMVAPDGKKYPVPANYASKSKLVEGDILKLTIANDGSLIYKQIQPVERKNLIGALTYENGNYTVLAEGKNYKVLFASVTYYKGQPGNQVAIVVPAEKDSKWAALESIIHDHGEEEKKEEKPPKEIKPKKVELPEENKEILESVKGRLDTEKKDDPSKAPGSQKIIERVETKTEELEKNEVPKDESDDSDLKTKSQTSMEENEDFVKEEKDTNALGEEVDKKEDEEKIAELEI